MHLPRFESRMALGTTLACARSALVALFAASALVACSEPMEVPTDSGRRDSSSGMDSSVSDSGTSDTGVPVDTGTTMDTGVPVDTGVIDMDSSSGDDGGGSGDGSASDAVSLPDAVVRDTRVGCVPGSITCATADRTRVCADDGGYVEMDCPAGQVCAEGVGCRACSPGARRCSADGSAVQECAADGMTWANMTTCDRAMGQVCEGFRCVDLCARAAAQRSYLGCEYWPTSLPNPALAQASFNFAVTIANPNAFPVSATFSGGGLAAPRTVTVMPNTTQTETLPWVSTLSMARTSLKVPNGAYRLTTTAPVAVYQFNPLQFQNGGANSFTNDASLLLPTHVLTGNYSVITHGAWTFGGSTYGDFGAVVGTRDGTTVNVRLSTAISAGTGVAAAAAGTMQTYMINRGEVLLLSSSTGSAACNAGNITGTTIEANAPVAAFGGHQCTQMPCGFTACDHLEEQLFPAETWGSRFVVSGLRERAANEVAVVRILSRVAGNNLTFTGIATPAGCATLAANAYCEFEASADFMVQGTAPLSIAQFMVGQDRVAGVGDPAMVLEVPTQQFRTNYVFNVPGSYTTNFVTVVYTTGSIPRMDGTPITAGVALAGTPFSVTRYTTTAGSHRMTADQPFGIKVTGTASYTSYMYPGGLDLNQLTAM